MPQTTEVKSDATVNCAGCNKHLKKVKRYYRNGKYFCSKTCWKAHSKKVSAQASQPV